MATKKRELQYVIDGYVNSGFYKAIKGATNAVARANKAVRGMNSLQAQSAAYSRRSASAARASGAGWIKAAVGMGLAYVSAQQLIGGYRAVMDETEGQIRANTRLQTLMLNNKDATLANVHAVQRFAQQQMKYTTIADDVLTTGASQIATYQLQARTIQKLLPAFQNLAVGQHGVNVNQDQAIQTANLIGKVYNGQVGALRRVGISFTKTQEKILKTGSESQKTAMLIKVINQNYGGLAKKMAQTPEGRIIRLKNAWGEIKEEIGYRLIPIQQRLISWLNSKLPQVYKLIDYVKQHWGEWAKEVDKIRQKAERLYGFIQRNWSWLKPMLLTVAGLYLAWRATILATSVAQGVLTSALKIGRAAFLLYRGAVNVAKAAQWVWNAAIAAGRFMARECTIEMIGLRVAITALTVVQKAQAAWSKIAAAAQWAWNVAMSANPIGLIIIAVAALIAGVVLLIKNWDKVKAFFVRAWVAVKRALKAAWDWFINFATNGPGRFIPFIQIIGVVVKYWKNIKAAIVTAWNWVVKFVGYVVGKQFGAIKAAIGFVVNIFNAVWGAIKHVWQWVQKLIYKFIGAEFKGIEKIIGAIVAVWNRVSSAIKAAWGWIVKFYDKAKAALGLKSNTSATTHKTAKAITAARAAGGPVAARNSYLVGERGPEIFIPRISGRIEPIVPKIHALLGSPRAPRLAMAGAASGGGGVTISSLTINIQTKSGEEIDGRRIAGDLARELERIERDRMRRSFE